MKRTISVLMLVSIALCVFSFASCGGSAVRLEKYVTFSAEGMEGAGTVTAEFDEEAFIRDNKNMKLTSEGKKNEWIKEAAGECTVAEMFCELCLGWELSPSERLSNGDTVTLTWNIDPMFVRYFSCSVKADPVSYTVQGLEQTPSFDPFADIGVSVGGVAPVFTYEILRGPNTPAEDGYSIKAALEAENGNYTVVLTAETYSDPEAYVRQYGKRMRAAEKRFPISSEHTAAHYVTAAAEIPAGVLQTLHVMSENEFRTAEVSGWENPESFRGVSYAGALTFLTKNTFLPVYSANSGHANYVFLVYKIDVEDVAGPFSYYYYTAVTDLIADADGSVETPVAFSETPHPDSYFADVPGFERNGLFYLGFATLSELRAYVAGSHSWLELTDDTLV